ncbi:MAG: NADH-quinone oxidoreductase subunit H [Candidatus Njordarchaeota archaeon]
MIELGIFALEIIIWLVVTILFAFFVEWLFRKMMGHLQNRVGPKLAGPIGILQPIADFIKLMNKKQISPEGTDDLFVDFLAIFGIWLMIMMTYFLPIFGTSGILTFFGDAIFILVLFAIGSLVYIITPYLFKSPYPTIGAGRRAELYLSYEIPMFLALAAVLFVAGSAHISDIIYVPFKTLYFGIPAFVWLLPALLVSLIGVMARVKKLPFDVPEAETEIASGWEAELSGRRLAFFNLLTDIKLLVGAGVIVTFFLGGPLGPMFVVEGMEWFLVPFWYCFWFTIKTLIVVIIITIIAGSVARFRIDQVLELFWKKLMPISVGQIVLLLVLGWLV